MITRSIDTDFKISLSNKLSTLHLI